VNVYRQHIAPHSLPKPVPWWHMPRAWLTLLRRAMGRRRRAARRMTPAERESTRLKRLLWMVQALNVVMIVAMLVTFSLAISQTALRHMVTP
jgi:hypothetical protein